MHSKTSMRTPLNRVRGLGSARSGTGHFWMQRVTAVSNALLVFTFVGILISMIGKPYEAAIATLSQPVVALLMLLFVISALVHMRIGMQTILEDYVHGELAKVVAVIANNFIAVAVGVVVVFSVLKIAFGG
jgi:succinate dehydrogenase / fumarate reductase membrane anchor subunit